MNRNFFEGRFLVNIVGNIMRQDDMFPHHNKKIINWERLYRIADYHKVSNVVYLGILGSSEEIDQTWKDKLFDRYQSALRFGSIYEREEAAVLRLLDFNGVECTVLTSSSIREFYEIPEAAGNSPLRLLLSYQDYSAAKGYLIDAGFTTDTYYRNHGERMRNAAGFSVVIYHRLPMETDKLQAQLRKFVAAAYLEPGYKGISRLSMEYSYLYYITETCYMYCCDMLNIRNLLDTFVVYTAYREEMNLKMVRDILKKLDIDALAELLIHIAAMWFGKRGDNIIDTPKENLGLYDEIEKHILGDDLDREEEHLQQAIQLKAQILKQAEKDAKTAQKRREREVKLMNASDKIKKFNVLKNLSDRFKRTDDDESIHLRGDVGYSFEPDGIVINTNFYSVKLPPEWLGHVDVAVEPMNEDYTDSKTRLTDRNPEQYRLRLCFSAEGMKLSVMDILMFSDPVNAAVMSEREGAQHMGMLTHMDEFNEYEGHMIAMYDNSMKPMMQSRVNQEMYETVLKKRYRVLDSLIPVNDPAARNENVFVRFDMLD